MRIRHENFRYWLSLCAVGVLLCLPVLSTTYHPLVDYPNHLARAYILHQYSEVPVYQAMYTRLFEPIPNLAIDLVLLFLLLFVDILAAGKIFLVITVILFVAGCHKLGKVIHGHPTWLALPCCSFVYSSMFLYGFVNYVFGVGAFCVALAYWLERRGKWTIKSLLLASALVFCAYLAHLSAYFFLGVSFVVIEACDFRASKGALRSTITSLVPLLPSAAAFSVFMGGSGSAGTVEWNTVSGKMIGALALLFTYDYTLDGFLAVGLLVTTIALVKRMKSVSVVRPTFVAGIVFVILYLLSPKVLFTSSGADARFVLPAALMIVMSLNIEVTERAGKILLCACLIIVSIRVGAIWNTWAILERRMEAEINRLMILPEGASVYPVFIASGDPGKIKLERSLEHTIHYLTIRRHAFVPTLFALRGQQPLLFRAKPAHAAPSNIDKERWLRDLVGYDYVWSYGISRDMRKSLNERASIISEADGFALWKVNKPGYDSVVF